MSDRDTLLAMAERCEQATGADDKATRLLGREVLLACGKGYVSPLYAWLNPAISLDVAMSLVPDDLSWEVRHSGVGVGGQATVWDYQRQPGFVGGRLGGGDIRVRDAATPALALCAAALRSRAAQIGGER